MWTENKFPNDPTNETWIHTLKLLKSNEKTKIMKKVRCKEKKGLEKSLRIKLNTGKCNVIFKSW